MANLWRALKNVASGIRRLASGAKASPRDSSTRVAQTGVASVVGCEVRGPDAAVMVQDVYVGRSLGEVPTNGGVPELGRHGSAHPVVCRHPITNKLRLRRATRGSGPHRRKRVGGLGARVIVSNGVASEAGRAPASQLLNVIRHVRTALETGAGGWEERRLGSSYGTLNGLALGRIAGVRSSVAW